MKFIGNVILLFKSRLSGSEKKILEQVIATHDSGAIFEIDNYSVCQILIKIGYKLEARIDYLYRTDKKSTDEYTQLKHKNKCIGEAVKKYSMQ